MGNRWQARQALHRGAAAALGAVLAASGVAAAPAHADLLAGALLAPEPKIDGIGSVTSPGYDCESTSASPVFACDPLPDDLLSLLSPVVLEAVATPGSGHEFEGWSGCPEPSGTTCTIPVLDLQTTVVKPIAEFVATSGGGGGDEPGTVPTVSITSWTPGRAVTSETVASFRFGMDPVREGWTFECRLTVVEGAAGSWSPCSSGVSYSELKLGDYLFEVRAVDAEKKTTSNTANQAWTVEKEAPSAAGVAIESGPAHRSWLASDYTQFRYTVAPDDASVVCRLDGKVKECSDHAVVLRSLSGGTHTFSVTAINSEGDWDKAERVFTVPRNNTQLKHSKGDWSKRSDRGHFNGSYSVTEKRGSFVKSSAKRIKGIALVVTKGNGHGTVKVMLGKKVLDRVSLHVKGKKVRKSQLVPIKTFRKPKRGVVKVVVTSQGKPVQIEGLGIATR